MKTAFLTFVYPGIENCFPEFLKSLKAQTDLNFTLYIVNDGMDKLSSHLMDLPFPFKIMNQSGSIAQLRKKGLLWILEDAVEILILGDADDCFEKNRIVFSKEILSQEPILANELVTFGETVKDSASMIGSKWTEGFKIKVENIRDENCMGMSNTALRTGNIPWNTLLQAIPDDILIFDWTFFTLLLHQINHAYFTKRTVTYYRRHAQNEAPLQMLTNDQILKGVQVKWAHYKAVRHLDASYQSRFEEFQNLREDLDRDFQLLMSYCETVRKKSKGAQFWWEGIKTPGDFKR